MNDKLKRVISSKSFWLGIVATGSAISGAIGYSSLSPEKQDQLASMLSVIISAIGM